MDRQLLQFVGVVVYTKPLLKFFCFEIYLISQTLLEWLLLEFVEMKVYLVTNMMT